MEEEDLQHAWGQGAQCLQYMCAHKSIRAGQVGQSTKHAQVGGVVVTKGALVWKGNLPPVLLSDWLISKACQGGTGSYNKVCAGPPWRAFPLPPLEPGPILFKVWFGSGGVDNVWVGLLEKVPTVSGLRQARLDRADPLKPQGMGHNVT